GSTSCVSPDFSRRKSSAHRRPGCSINFSRCWRGRLGSRTDSRQAFVIRLGVQGTFEVGVAQHRIARAIAAVAQPGLKVLEGLDLVGPQVRVLPILAVDRTENHRTLVTCERLNTADEGLSVLEVFLRVAEVHHAYRDAERLRCGCDGG